MIELKSIKKTYPDGEQQLTIFNNCSIQIPQGKRVAVMGPSGSGKSTLLNLCAGLTSLDAGELIINNNRIHSLNSEELEQHRRETVGIIFQNHSLLPQLTALENILLPCLASHINPEEIQSKAELYLEQLGITHVSHKQPKQLSGGECQRVAIIRAIVYKPQVILADEPTGALDNNNAIKFTELLTELCLNEKMTLLMATHSEDLSKHMDITYTIKNHQLET